MSFPSSTYIRMETWIGWLQAGFSGISIGLVGVSKMSSRPAE